MSKGYFVGFSGITAIPKLKLYEPFDGHVSPYRGIDPGLELMEDFAFVDSNGLVWTAHKFDITDGASVPWFSQPMIGTPLNRSYLGPSVLHDVYCRDKPRTKWATDNMFYEAMICNGVDKLKAQSMWAAVYVFGQWW
jgi:hypothetical protein